MSMMGAMAALQAASNMQGTKARPRLDPATLAYVREHIRRRRHGIDLDASPDAVAAMIRGDIVGDLIRIERETRVEQSSATVELETAKGARDLWIAIAVSVVATGMLFALALATIPIRP